MKLLGIDAVGYDHGLPSGKPARDVVGATGVGVGDDEVRVAGERALQPQAEPDEALVAAQVPSRGTDTPDRPDARAQGLEEHGENVGLHEIAVDDVGPLRAYHLRQLRQEAHQVTPPALAQRTKREA